MPSGRRIGRQEEGESGAGTGRACDMDLFLVQFDNPLGNGQSESGMIRFALIIPVFLIKAVKNMRQIFLGNTAAGIVDADCNITILQTECESNRTPFRSMAHGVI